MRRSLIHFRRQHLAVALGAAVATAVLTGALLVGDSVRGSLEDLARERLGGIDEALAAERLFREELAGEMHRRMGSASTVAPAILLSGSAVHGSTSARASRLAIAGVDGRFAALYADGAALDFARREGQALPSVIVNRALADELGAVEGDELLLSFEDRGAIPRETLVGRAPGTEALASVRLAIARIVPDRGVGGFAFSAQQSRPLNAFVELDRLQRVLGERGRANALFVARGGAAPDAAARALGESVTADDLGLVVRRAGDAAVVESRQFVLPEALVEAATAFAREHGAEITPVLTYLANEMRLGDRTLAYSTVAALGSGGREPALRLTDGSPAPPLGEGEIYLNAWAGEDLGVEQVAGAAETELAMRYYVLGSRDELTEGEQLFRVRGVVALDGLGADRTLTPEFPGMSDAEDMSSWDPPFPVDLGRVRPRDEAYWDSYRGAPKAFVSLATGQALWRSRFGELTSLRLMPAAGTAAAFAGQLERELPRRLEPRTTGLALLAVRAQAMAAAQGATDFAQLFLGFSLFLITSAALLVALLFRLGVEQRAGEVGLLLAVGYGRREVRRRFLAEGTLVAALGTVLGLAGAVGYAGLMLWGLRTLWLPAVGTPMLFLHVPPASLVAGGAISLAVVVISIALALRSLARLPAPSLLAGAVASGVGRGEARRARRVAALSLAAAAALLAAAVFADASASPSLAFGIGACLLIAGLAGFAVWCRGAGRRRANALGAAGTLAMGARNSARSAGRSLLSVALVASACFLIVAVGAQRGKAEGEVTDRASGAGGFTLVAESDAPIYADLGGRERRRELGFDDEAEAAVAGLSIVPFRLLPGEDASCLNLFRPQRPRVLGVPPEMVARGGFTFQKTSREVENPWTLLDEDLGDGVIPAFADANSATWILKLGLGDDFELADEAGKPVKLRLVGLLAKSLFQSEILIAKRPFEERFPSRGGYRYFLVEAPAEKAPAAAEAPEFAEAPRLAEALERSLGRFGFDATSTAERLASFQAVENTYLATFQTLGGLGLLLGTVGLGVILLRNVLERRGELAALRAFGFEPRRLMALVVAENAFLLALGIALGAAAALVAVAPHLAASAARVPWPSLAGTLALVFAVGLLASLAAVRGALSVPLLPALRAE